MTRIVVAAAVACLWAGSVYAECSQADKAALQQLDERWGIANRSGDRGFQDQLLADDYVGITFAGTSTKAQLLESATQLANGIRSGAQKPADAKEDYYQIACTATTATITHRLVTIAGAGASAQPTYSRSIHVLEKRNGRWLVVATMSHGLPDPAQLTYLVQEWNDALKTHDSGWFERNLAAEYSGVDAAGMLRSKAQTAEFVRTNRRTFTSIVPSDIAIRVVGDTAVLTGVNSISGKEADGSPLDYRVRGTATFIRREGRWLVLATQTSILPRPSAVETSPR